MFESLLAHYPELAGAFASFSTNVVIRVTAVMAILIVSLALHEYAHAWVATRLGDDTARLSGRLTLNLLAHVDPIGSIAIPLIGNLFGLSFIAWAKPVPITPTRFTRRLSMGQAVALTAVAGPIANLLLAFAAALVFALIGLGGMREAIAPIGLVAALAVMLNIGLFFFNLIPIPPLDGSKILMGVLPPNLSLQVARLGNLSIFFFMLILFSPKIQSWFWGPVEWLSRFMVGM